MTAPNDPAPLDVAALDALRARATGGTWAAGLSRECEHTPSPCPDGCPDARRRVSVARVPANDDGLHTTVCDFDTADGFDAARADAEYVAALHNAWPALLDEVERLRAEDARLRDALDTIAHTGTNVAPGMDPETSLRWTVNDCIRTAVRALSAERAP